MREYRAAVGRAPQAGTVGTAVLHGIARANDQRVGGRRALTVLHQAEYAAHCQGSAGNDAVKDACTAKDRRVTASWSARLMGHSPPVRSAAASACNSSNWPLRGPVAL